MKLTKELEELSKVCTSHFGELCQEKDRIKVFSIELESSSIWGGLGDRDTDMVFYITKNGWLKSIIESEFGEYQKGDGIIEKQEKAITCQEIEDDLNGQKATINDLKELLDFYYDIRKKYISEFNL